MLKPCTASLIFLLFITASITGQERTNVGITVGTGISNDINNLGYKFQPVWAYKAGFFANHQLNKIVLNLVS
jgi:hypothetical protein